VVSADALTNLKQIFCLLTGTCNGHEHLLPLRSSHAPLLEPSRRKVNPDAKESRPHRGIGRNVLDTESRLVVTRDDRGQNTINLPEILGTGAAAGISSAYYPQQYRNRTETGQRWLINAAFDGGVMVVREFWPEFSHTVFRIRR
jgi:hypothetical protein